MTAKTVIVRGSKSGRMNSDAEYLPIWWKPIAVGQGITAKPVVQKRFKSAALSGLFHKS